MKKKGTRNSRISGSNETRHWISAVPIGVPRCAYLDVIMVMFMVMVKVMVMVMVMVIIIIVMMIKGEIMAPGRSNEAHRMAN